MISFFIYLSRFIWKKFYISISFHPVSIANKRAFTIEPFRKLDLKFYTYPLLTKASPTIVTLILLPKKHFNKVRQNSEWRDTFLNISHELVRYN